MSKNLISHQKCSQGTYLMSFSGTKTLIGTLGGKCKFYALLDQSANIKVIEHHKPSNFHIGEFSS
jgi:pantothenate kinase